MDRARAFGGDLVVPCFRKAGHRLDDARGEPHVLDFGLTKTGGEAKRMQDNVTGAGGSAALAEDRFTVTGQFVCSLPCASLEARQTPLNY